jgi:hypothetical protein
MRQSKVLIATKTSFIFVEENYFRLLNNVTSVQVCDATKMPYIHQLGTKKIFSKL